MKRYNARRTRFATSNVAVGVLALLAACTPAQPPTQGPGPEPAGTMVQVGLLVDTTQVELGSSSDFQIVDSTGRVLHRLSAEEQATISSGAPGQLVVSVGGVRSTASEITAHASGDGLLSIGGKPYRGSALVRPRPNGRVTAINLVDMESYLLGVVPYEIGRVGPELLEASKAQAVAARTYAFRYLGRRANLGFDVFATVADQVYGGAAGEHPPVSEAVLATAGEILTYNGEPIEAFYHSTCAGQTAAIEEVWPEQPRPYLVSVVDVNPQTGIAFDSVSSRFRWTQRWSADSLTTILNRTLRDSLPAGVRDIGELRDFQVLERTASNRIKRMRITTSNGIFHLGGDRIRWIFLTPTGAILNSSRFDVTTERDAQGRVVAVVASGGGWGHGIGMCQVGAMGRARAGQDYRTILRTYYPGTSISMIN